jgi:dynein heavy chain
MGLNFLRADCNYMPSIQNLVASLANLFELLLEYHKIEAHKLPAANGAVNICFIHAYIWTLGGFLEPDLRFRFDLFCRQIFHSAIELPPEGLLYDYYIDVENKAFIHWSNLLPAVSDEPPISEKYDNILVPTMDVIRYTHLLKVLLTGRKPVLLSGPTGTGKSKIIERVLEEGNNKDQFISNVVHLSKGITSAFTQKLLESNLEKKRSKVLSPPKDKLAVVFLDDLSAPFPDENGTQPPLEMIRQYCDQGGVYERKSFAWNKIENVNVISAITTGGHKVTPRLLRHFHVLYFPEPDSSQLNQILRGLIQHSDIFQSVPTELKKLFQSLVSASASLYQRIHKEFLPIPSKPHYTYNLRDLYHLIQGNLW